MIIGAKNTVESVTNPLNNGLLDITGGIIDDGISEGVTGGDTCYAYTNSIRESGFEATEFYRDSNLSGGTSGVVMQYDQLMYQVYFKLVRALDRQQSPRQTPGAGTVGTSDRYQPRGSRLLQCRCEDRQETKTDRYLILFGSYVPSDQDKSDEETISYAGDGGELVDSEGTGK